MMSEFNFSERMNIIFAVSYVMAKIRSDPKFEFGAPVTLERLQSILDKVGGNVELNKQRSLPSKIKASAYEWGCPNCDCIMMYNMKVCPSCNTEFDVGYVPGGGQK